MSATRDPLDHLRKVKTEKARKEWIARYLSSRTDDSAELHHRALFVTRIREANLWPKE